MELKKKVLIAEDSSVIQNITKKVLLFQNYDIDIANNGKQVLEKLSTSTYDAILLDINMPKMNGMDCAKEIRKLKDSSKSGIPIIAVTGNANNYTEQDFKKVGINEYIEKPIDFDILIDKLNRIVERPE